MLTIYIDVYNLQCLPILQKNYSNYVYKIYLKYMLHHLIRGISESWQSTEKKTMQSL